MTNGISLQLYAKPSQVEMQDKAGMCLHSFDFVLQ